MSSSRLHAPSGTETPQPNGIGPAPDSPSTAGDRRRLRRRPLGQYRYVRLRWRVLFAGIDFFGAFAFAVARCARAFFVQLFNGPPQPPPDTCCNDPRAILLVQLDHLGDGLLSTVMLPPLRRRYPLASIEVLASEATREVFEAMGEVDRVHVSRWNRFSECRPLGWMAATLWWGWTLRKRHVDLAIDPRGDFPAAVILWLCGARRRLGWHSGGGRFLLTDSPRFVADRPETDSRLALLAELGICPLPHQSWRPVFRPSQPARNRVARLLDGLARHAPTAGPRFVLHVASGTPAKLWPIDHWQELIGRLVVEHGAQIVLVGTAGDRTMARRILSPVPCPGVADWTGRLDLAELGALLQMSDLFIGADSGPAHLAATVGTPAVVLFSGTNDSRQWRPFGEQVRVVRHAVECSPCHRLRCPLGDHPCMRRLSPEQVAEAAGALYGEVVCSAAGSDADRCGRLWAHEAGLR